MAKKVGKVPVELGPMETRAVRVLSRTWDVIGYDTLACIAEEEGKNVNRVTIPRDEVIDMVTSCGFKGGYPATYGDDSEAVAWLEGKTDTELAPVYAKAFPFKTYGM